MPFWTRSPKLARSVSKGVEGFDAVDIASGGSCRRTAFPAPATYRYSGSPRRTADRLVVGQRHQTAQRHRDRRELDRLDLRHAALGDGLARAWVPILRRPNTAATITRRVRTRQSASTLTPIVRDGQLVLLAVSRGRLALDANTRHFVVIEPGLLAGLFALPAQLDAWKDRAVTWITPTTAQAQTLTTDPRRSATRPAGVPAKRRRAFDRTVPPPVTIWYDPNTLVPDEIIVPSQNAVLTRERS